VALTRSIVFAQQHGVVKKWDENGVKREEIPVAHGYTEGVMRTWHKNGKPDMVAHFWDGLLHGAVESYFSTGAVRFKLRYGNGRIIWDGNGTIDNLLRKLETLEDTNWAYLCFGFYDLGQVIDIFGEPDSDVSSGRGRNGEIRSLGYGCQDGVVRLTFQGTFSGYQLLSYAYEGRGNPITQRMSKKDFKTALSKMCVGQYQLVDSEEFYGTFGYPTAEVVQDNGHVTRTHHMTYACKDGSVVLELKATKLSQYRPQDGFRWVSPSGFSLENVNIH